LALLAAARAADYNYDNNGEDWPDRWSMCGGTQQSPIDLPRNDSAVPVLNQGDDNFNRIYDDMENQEVRWTDTTSMVEAYGDRDRNKIYGFTSDLGYKWGYSRNWLLKQFHFHSHSEHSIDGEFFDLEMHAVHSPIDFSK